MGNFLHMCLKNEPLVEKGGDCIAQCLLCGVCGIAHVMINIGTRKFLPVISLLYSM